MQTVAIFRSHFAAALWLTVVIGLSLPGVWAQGLPPAGASCTCTGDVDQNNVLTPADALCIFRRFLNAPSCFDTLPVSNATANAGADQDVTRGTTVTLDGSASSDPDDNALTYTWTQVSGPDVTNGSGVFNDITPTFMAPDAVSTVIFDLTVSDGRGRSTPDRIQINVLENHTLGLFVDGDRGNDESGDGSRSNPYATISGAINRVQGPDHDIYVMTRADGASYEESETLRPQTTISLYGGFGRRWIRDVVQNRTRLTGASVAIDFGAVAADVWFSGFELMATSPTEPGDSVIALRAESGTASLFIEDNTIMTGDAAQASEDAPGGSSYGILLANLNNVVLQRNTIVVGNGGNSVTGSRGGDGARATTNGANGSGATGGAGGRGGVSSVNGGRGGDGGRGLIPQDGAAGQDGGGAGGSGGIGDRVGEGRVGDGGGGAGGRGGNGGRGGDGRGQLTEVFIPFSAAGLFGPPSGTSGSKAGDGGGGGGGGGGAGGVGLDGGAGGGGGGGGQGGFGGQPGQGGGASIGVLLRTVGRATIAENTITTGNGGRGGNGGAGGTGGNGTAGGVGAPNVCSFLGCDFGRSGDGGEGGGGGSGGIGGQGGGGGGGPSYGILIGPNLTPLLRNNRITTGTGGNGGSGGAAGLGGSPGGGGGSTGGSGGCCAFLLETAGDAGSGGNGGWSYAVFDLNPDDGSRPVLEGNTLSPGNPGEGSALNGVAGMAGETNF